MLVSGNGRYPQRCVPLRLAIIPTLLLEQIPGLVDPPWTTSKALPQAIAGDLLKTEETQPRRFSLSRVKQPGKNLLAVKGAGRRGGVAH